MKHQWGSEIFIQAFMICALWNLFADQFKVITDPLKVANNGLTHISFLGSLCSGVSSLPRALAISSGDVLDLERDIVIIVRWRSVELCELEEWWRPLLAFHFFALGICLKWINRITLLNINVCEMSGLTLSSLFIMLEQMMHDFGLHITNHWT